MSRPARPDLRVYADLEALSRAAAEALGRLAQAAVRERGRFTLALSGGSTPVRLHRLLAGECGKAVPWAMVHVFWADERYVPPEDPRSSYRMARETLLDHVPVPRGQVYPMPTLLPEPEEAAERYEEILKSCFAGQRPRLDLLLLGLGADGHTASLFPDSPALEQKARLVAAVRAAADPPLRLTLTLAAINQAANIHFLVSGREKAAALGRALAEPPDITRCPASGVRPVEGEVVWWADEEAAGRS